MLGCWCGCELSVTIFTTCYLCAYVPSSLSAEWAEKLRALIQIHGPIPPKLSSVYKAGESPTFMTMPVSLHLSNVQDFQLVLVCAYPEYGPFGHHRQLQSTGEYPFLSFHCHFRIPKQTNRTFPLPSMHWLCAPLTNASL